MEHVCFANPTEISTGKEAGLLHTFFLAGQNNSLYMADDMKQCIFLKTFKSEIDQLLFYNEKSRLVILCHDQSLIQFLVFIFIIQYCDDGSITPCSKVKLNIIGKEGFLKAEWVASGLLATVSSDYSVKFWDLLYESNYSLTTTSFSTKDSNTIKVVGSKIDKTSSSQETKAGSVIIRQTIGIQRKDELTSFSFDRSI